MKTVYSIRQVSLKGEVSYSVSSAHDTPENLKTMYEEWWKTDIAKNYRSIKTFIYKQGISGSLTIKYILELERDVKPMTCIN